MARTIAKDHDQKRGKILTAAAEVFAREGIARASMNAVARAAGVSKANIYHYHTSKDELLFDILNSYLSELRDIVFALDRSGMSPDQQLHAVTKSFLLAYEGMDNEHKIQSEGLPLLAPEKQNVLKSYQREMVDLVAGILRDVAPQTLGTDPKACRDVTMSIFGMLNWFFMWQPKADKTARVSYAKTVADLVLDGVRVK